MKKCTLLLTGFFVLVNATYSQPKGLAKKTVKPSTSIQKIELESVVNEDLIGGFVLEFNNNLVDASIQRELRDLKTQFEKNVFVQQIR